MLEERKKIGTITYRQFIRHERRARGMRVEKERYNFKKRIIIKYTG
jgi:hypothetical protein